ncbi:MAG: rRNA maturation RNase YbeY [Planctomycetota bacterium]
MLPQQERESPESLHVDVIVDDDIQTPMPIEQMIEAVRTACRFQACDRGSIGIRITDDPEIHRINRDYLQHDYPTDVISFGYQLEPPLVEGELVVSFDTARREADVTGWCSASELLLYIVHGTLHICGLDDQEIEARNEMRHAEQHVMRQLGVIEIEKHGVDVQTSEPSKTQRPSTLKEKRA